MSKKFLDGFLEFDDGLLKAIVDVNGEEVSSSYVLLPEVARALAAALNEWADAEEEPKP